MNAKARAERMIALTLTRTYETAAQKIDSSEKRTEDIERLVGHDYARSLRRHLPYRELIKLEDAFRGLLPGFNCEVMGMMPIDQLAAIAASLNVYFEASPYERDAGLALRGFYVPRKEGLLERPLIYLNTAHHPLAVSATFCHEVGHHMRTKVLCPDDNREVHFSVDANYAFHLEEPNELAADAMVSIAGYPKRIARKIFATPWEWGLVAKAKDVTEAALSEVRSHLKKAYGFDILEGVPESQKLHYLSGMIHFARLRWALLAEYDI
jgi:hypothetical protein